MEHGCPRFRINIKMLSKIVKISLIVLSVPALAFVGLVIYEMTIGLEKSSQEVATLEPPPSDPVIKTVEPPKQEIKAPSPKPMIKSVEPSLPSSSEPVIVSVEFPKLAPLNQKITITVNFKDREGDVIKLVFHDLSSGTTSGLDYSSRVAGRTSGSLTFTQTSKVARINIRRLILVDAAGNQSPPYILTYQAGDIDAYYDRFEAEILRDRPVERRKKINFFILSNAEYKTELGNESSFLSEDASIGTVSLAVTKMFEVSVLPQINGLWDQCGVAFDLGVVKAVRPEKVNLLEGGTLVSLFGTLFETGESFIITGDTDEDAEGITLIKSALPSFGIPNGDITIFIAGPKFMDVETELENVAAHAIKNLALVSWRYVHFLNETRGEIVLPKNIMKTLAHEIGHTLELDHPGKGKAVPEDKFSEFNLMRQGKLRSELIPEQCSIVAGQF